MPIPKAAGFYFLDVCSVVRAVGDKLCVCVRPTQGLVNMAVSSKDKKKKKRRRAAPLLAPPPIKSRRVARLITSKFHEITHELESLSKVKESGKEGKRE